MKRIIYSFTLSLLAINISYSQENNYLGKVQTLDFTIETLYGVISGEAGEKRDWELFKFLFTEDARLIPSGANQEGKVGYRSITPDGYIESSGEWLETNGFFEKEIYRITESFGANSTARSSSLSESLNRPIL